MSLQQDSEDEKRHEKLLKDISTLGSVTKKRFVTSSSLKISLCQGSPYQAVTGKIYRFKQQF